MPLADHAMLVRLHRTSLPIAIKDKAVTRNVLATHGATGKVEDVGYWVDKRFPKEAFAPIAKIDAQITALHRKNTVPFFWDGGAVLPTKRFQPYRDGMRALRHERETAVALLVDQWDYWVGVAQVQKNGLFKADHYPPKAKVAGTFTMKVQILPIPSAEHFVNDLNAQEMESIRAQMEEQMREQENIIRRELVSRLTAPTARLVTALTEPEKIIRQPALDAIEEIARNLADFNVIGDTEIEAARRELLALCGSATAEDLRSSEHRRAKFADAAQNVLDQMGAAFGFDATIT